MRIHHLSCGSLCPHGGRFGAADARTANAERLRELAGAHGEEVTLFSSHDPRELERERAASGAAAA